MFATDQFGPFALGAAVGILTFYVLTRDATAKTLAALLAVVLGGTIIGFVTTGGFGSGAVNNYLTGFLGGVLIGALLFVIIKRNLTILGRQLFQI